MTEKKKKIVFDDAHEPMGEGHYDDAHDLTLEDPLAIKKSIEARKVRKVAPLGMRVLVRVRKDSNVSDGGLYLPEGAKQSTQESLLAEVIEVASATDDDSDDETNISGIPNGAVVLIGKNSGIRVPWDDQLRVVETKEVIAIVHEVSLT